MKLDAIDRRILSALQRDGRMQNVGSRTRSGCRRRRACGACALLEEAGVIEKYVAVLNPAKVGKGLTIFTRVWLKGQDAESVNRFAEAVQQMPEVVECHLMAGDCDFLLRVVAADIDDYRRFQMETLTRIPGVLSVKTDIPMQKVKLTSALPT